MTTAPVAARLAAVGPEGAVEIEPGFLDSIDALEGEMAAMRKAMASEKQAAGKQRSSREDLDLRAKVRPPATWHQPLQLQQCAFFWST